VIEPGFLPMPVRIGDERRERLALAAKAMQYYNAFLDDVLRAILPHDLIVIGAETGLGKTDLALSIAMGNAMHERRVGYFALEAEPLELERRTKFAWLSAEAWRRGLPLRGDLNYTDWYLGRCEDIVGDLDQAANQWMLSNLCGLRTFYRGHRFDRGDLRKAIEAATRDVDAFVIDHLHYVDSDEDDNESKGLGDTTKVIRDVALQLGKPVILVAHLRKKDARAKTIVPTIDDFHGSSNVVKIATQVITIAPATGVVEDPNLKWWQAPTFVAVLKDRRAGAPPFVALTHFDKRTRRYEDRYTLGRLNRSRTEWEQIDINDRPGWASGHKQLVLEVAS